MLYCTVSGLFGYVDAFIARHVELVELEKHHSGSMLNVILCQTFSENILFFGLVLLKMY